MATRTENIGACECCGGGNPPVIVSGSCISGCAVEGLPQCYEVAIAGLTNGGSCIGCSPTNGTWYVMKRTTAPGGNFCHWSSGDGSLGVTLTIYRFECNTGTQCTSSFPLVALSVSESGGTRTWTATVVVGTSAASCNLVSAQGNYSLAESTATSCLTAKTLSFVSETGDCTGWPSSITFDPAGCP